MVERNYESESTIDRIRKNNNYSDVDMKLICERCNGIINTNFEKYERVERIEKGCGTDEIILCAKCSNDFNRFLYKKPKTFNDCEQSYLQSAT